MLPAQNEAHDTNIDIKSDLASQLENNNEQKVPMKSSALTSEVSSQDINYIKMLYIKKARGTINCNEAVSSQPQSRIGVENSP